MHLHLQTFSRFQMFISGRRAYTHGLVWVFICKLEKKKCVHMTKDIQRNLSETLVSRHIKGLVLQHPGILLEILCHL